MKASHPRRYRVAPLLVALVVSTDDADAARAVAPVVAPKVDPKVVRAIDSGLIGGAKRGPTGDAPVLLTLDAPVTPEALDRLRATGAIVGAVDGKAIWYDRYVPAHVDGAALAALSAMPEVTKIALVSGTAGTPLDHSAELVRLADARGSHPALDRMTGSGVVIGDVDTMVDPFHPTFFRGDAGYYDWLDVDGDGKLTPGVDTIDLNRNGVVDTGEVALDVRAETVDFYAVVQPARAAGFDPGIDWLYLDTNANGSRDYGAASGFTDTDPALGEPLFVPDDVNRNGQLDVGERVVRLGTSKFREIYVNLDYSTYVANHVYTRGTDLATTVINYSSGALYGFGDALHATGVCTILAGDVPLVGRRWVGFAPDADIVLAWDIDSSSSLPVNGATWLLGQSPDVMLYELAAWTGDALDGTDAMSTLIDASSASITHTCPTGDQGSAGKHADADVAAGGTTALHFDLPATDKIGDGPITYAELSFDVTGGTAATIVLTTPIAETIDPITAAAGTGVASGTLANGSSYYATVQTTSRNTQFVDVILYAADASSPNPPVGEWTANVTATTALHVDAYVSDDVSSWGVGAQWDANIANDTSTVGIPSVADHCIAVGAHPNHIDDAAAPWYEMYYGDYNVADGYAETQGQVRAYSPLGPRIDGVQKPDVLAPDNPWVAALHSPGKYEEPYGGFLVFGGTSGASPHVTGTAALLAQAGIHGDAARDAIRAGAVSDAVTGAVPNKSYGFGRLDSAAALGAKIAETGDPSITLTIVPASPHPGDTVTLQPTVLGVDGTTTGLEVKWDSGYDGTWDTPYAAPAPYPVTSTVIADLPYKARVRDAAGHVAEAVAWVRFTAAPPVVEPTLDSGITLDATDSEGGAETPEAGAEGGVLSSKSSGCSCQVGVRPEGPSYSSVSLVWAAAGILVLGVRRRRSPRSEASTPQH